MSFRLWEAIKNPDNRAIISWLGGGAAVVAFGIWTVVTFVVEHKNAPDKQGGTNTILSEQGIASGGNASIGGNVTFGPTKEQIEQIQKPLVGQLGQKDAQIDALKNLIKSLLEKNREVGPGAEQAVGAAVLLIAQGAGEGNARLQQALAFLKENEIADATRLLNAVARAEKDRKDAAIAYRNLGAVAGLADPKRALDAYEKAVVLDPDDLGSLYWAGWIQIDYGDLFEAQARLERVLTLAKTDDEAFYKYGALLGLGDIKKQRGDLASARKSYEGVLAADRPAQALARERLAALAATEAARASKEAQAKLSKAEPATLVPDDIQQALDHRGHALLIGVSNYTSGWPQLPNVKNDLQDLKAGLEPYFETVETVPNPTVAQLRDRMGEFLLGQWNKPDERLFFYYSGHGFTQFNRSSRDNDGYITGSDTPLYSQTDGRAVENAVPFNDVNAWNLQTRARHVLMVFDSSFSGSLFHTKGTKTEPNKYEFDSIRRMLGQPIRYYITSGRQNEEVTADSTFAKLLLRGLRGEADVYHEGIISAEELGSYLYHEVPKYSQGLQTPQFNSIANVQLSEGQFFFLTGLAATR